jgi:uncharacterized membrane protein
MTSKDITTKRHNTEDLIYVGPVPVALGSNPCPASPRPPVNADTSMFLPQHILISACF